MRKKKPVVMVGGKGCTHLEREGVERLTCVTPPGTGSVSVTVSVGGEEGVHQANYTYEEPVIHAISPSSGGCSGGYVVTINGNGLQGSENMSTIVEVDGQECLSTTVVDQHNVKCVVPPTKNGGNVTVTAKIGT